MTATLVVGRRLTRAEARRAIDEGVVAVLDLTAEIPERPELIGLPYLNLPVLDLTAPSPATLSRAAEFVAAHRPHGRVLVHCALGYGRSACVAAACLLAAGEVPDVASAVSQVCLRRRKAVFSPVGFDAIGQMASGPDRFAYSPDPAPPTRCAPATASAG